MKPVTLKKYSELIKELSGSAFIKGLSDNTLVEDFTSGLIKEYGPAGDKLAYRMIIESKDQAELYCRPQACMADELWVKYDIYLEVEERKLRIIEALKKEEAYINDLLTRTRAKGYRDFTDVQLKKVYSKAYEDGHSCGVQEVENYYFDYLELVEDVLKVKK